MLNGFNHSDGRLLRGRYGPQSWDNGPLDVERSFYSPPLKSKMYNDVNDPV